MVVGNGSVGISASVTLKLNNILALKDTPFVLCPAVHGYVNVLQSAFVNYIPSPTSLLSNLTGDVVFSLKNNDTSEFTEVSQRIAASTVMGNSQMTMSTFSALTPFDANIVPLKNQPLVVSVTDSNPTGGSEDMTMLMVSFTYALLRVE